MELKLQNGDYLPDSAGGVEGCAGAEEVLARVLFRQTARRGALPFLPKLGSQLYLVLREKPSARLAAAKQYVAQALAQETDVSVTDVALTDTPQGLEITVKLLWQGKELAVNTVVGGM